MEIKPYRHSMFFTIALSSVSEDDVSGILFCPLLKKSVEFQGLTKLFIVMDKIMEDCNIPKYDERFRKFGLTEKISTMHLEYVDCEENQFKDYLTLSIKTSKKCEYVFCVEMMRRQNYSWQGKITWVGKNKIKYFRSELELMKLIYSI